MKKMLLSICKCDVHQTSLSSRSGHTNTHARTVQNCENTVTFYEPLKLMVHEMLVPSS